MNLTKRLFAVVGAVTLLIASGYTVYAYYESGRASFQTTDNLAGSPVTQMSLSHTGDICAYWLHQYSPDITPEWVSLNPIEHRAQRAWLGYGGKRWIMGTGFMVGMKREKLPAFFRAMKSSGKDVFGAMDSIKCNMQGGMRVTFSRLLTPNDKEYLSRLAEIHFQK